MEQKFMKEALKEAQKAYDKLEIPVGAVIVKNGRIISRAHNLKETKQTATAHAEILAIQKANKKLNNWRLVDCDIYVTLEPCDMCMGAILSSRIKNIYIGTLDPKKKEKIDINKYKEEYDTNIEYGIMQEKSEEILKNFFKDLRKSGGIK
jgi:tRNA(adenine34) deaminase